MADTNPFKKPEHETECTDFEERAAIDRAEALILTKGRTQLSAEQRAILELAQVLRALIMRVE